MKFKYFLIFSVDFCLFYPSLSTTGSGEEYKSNMELFRHLLAMPYMPFIGEVSKKAFSLYLSNYSGLLQFIHFGGFLCYYLAKIWPIKKILCEPSKLSVNLITPLILSLLSLINPLKPLILLISIITIIIQTVLYIIQMPNCTKGDLTKVRSQFLCSVGLHIFIAALNILLLFGEVYALNEQIIKWPLLSAIFKILGLKWISSILDFIKTKSHLSDALLLYLTCGLHLFCLMAMYSIAPKEKTEEGGGNTESPGSVFLERTPNAQPNPSTVQSSAKPKPDETLNEEVFHESEQALNALVEKYTNLFIEKKTWENLNQSNFSKNVEYIKRRYSEEYNQICASSKSLDDLHSKKYFDFITAENIIQWVNQDIQVVGGENDANRIRFQSDLVNAIKRASNDFYQTILWIKEEEFVQRLQECMKHEANSHPLISEFIKHLFNLKPDEEKGIRNKKSLQEYIYSLYETFYNLDASNISGNKELGTLLPLSEYAPLEISVMYAAMALIDLLRDEIEFMSKKWHTNYRTFYIANIVPDEGVDKITKIQDKLKSFCALYAPTYRAKVNNYIAWAWNSEVTLFCFLSILEKLQLNDQTALRYHNYLTQNNIFNIILPIDKLSELEHKISPTTSTPEDSLFGKSILSFIGVKREMERTALQTGNLTSENIGKLADCIRKYAQILKTEDKQSAQISNTCIYPPWIYENGHSGIIPYLNQIGIKGANAENLQEIYLQSTQEEPCAQLREKFYANGIINVKCIWEWISHVPSKCEIIDKDLTNIQILAGGIYINCQELDKSLEAINQMKAKFPQAKQGLDLLEKACKWAIAIAISAGGEGLASVLKEGELGKIINNPGTMNTQPNQVKQVVWL